MFYVCIGLIERWESSSLFFFCKYTLFINILFKQIFYFFLPNCILWEAKAEIHSIIRSTEDPYILSFPVPISACCNTCLGNPVARLFDRGIQSHFNDNFQESLEKYFQSWKPNGEEKLNVIWKRQIYEKMDDAD